MKDQEYTNEQINTLIEAVKATDHPEEQINRWVETYEAMRPEKRVDITADIKQWSQDKKDGIQRDVKGPITEGKDKADIEAWAKRN